ncbi:sugar porter family MFS transporter [Actinotignum sanguinis]|uniref:Sugar porter family MFS transporter n=2 Tax=Actinomycetaceae TaxID=2049 RepID=A0ABZ0RAY8_9ACTO|nr:MULTISPECIES: sugar porter family MFS transporter [Actinotignum]WPJ89271.1 sugar porter family MFS transporter [Schaalia turicensis]MDE1552855.1 sugar porter family MFS transporter [Actinotignum sanguinis]MDE1565572.1 sugar porter family MFS transporter [Actinotignum sanguinis]MDE1577342.1 sugar porter family MFS transporter [Actinotignum sanguinis]MDE1642898.1 sugar porter family MFS transporter [Actinotignum sanguinis]
MTRNKKRSGGPATSAKSAQSPAPLDPVIKRRIIIVCLAAAVGGFLFGYDTSVINGAVDSIAGSRTGWDLSAFMSGISVSCALFGCVIGAWFTSHIADRLGRVPTIFIAAILFVVCSIFSAIAPTVWIFIIFRFVGGLGVGLASVIGPAYIAEVAPAQMRGFLGSFQQMAIAFGILAAVVVNASYASASGGADETFWFGMPTWRIMLLSMIVPALIMLIVSLKLPESPRFLVMKGRDKEAAAILQRLTGEKDPEGKVKEIRATLSGEKAAKLSDLRGKTFGLRKVVWIAMAVAALQQLSGVNIILYYDSSLWKSVGFSEQLALNISVYRTIGAIIATILAMFIVDKVGRRFLLITGSSVMTIFLGIAALGFYQADVDGASITLPGMWGPITLVSVYIFYLAFCFTWGPVMWVVLGEIFPNNIRALGVAVASAVNWIANFLVSTTFPPLKDAIGTGNVYLLYAVFAAVSLIFVMKALPETAGVELEDMPAE